VGFLNLNRNKLELGVFILLFGLLAVFLVHNFDSIGQDIGRHLKTGEIIWQTNLGEGSNRPDQGSVADFGISVEVPKTNLFSFTEPDFQFINHHWLSEVIFFGIYSWTGFTGLILLKVFLILLSFLLLFFLIGNLLMTSQGRGTCDVDLWINDIASRLSTGVWPLVISFLFSIFIFISRTEVRPEIFSFAILAFFLLVLFKAKYSLATSEVRGTSDVKTLSWLWFLPLAQLLWVNLHIYFFIGPFLILAFLIDRIIVKGYLHIKKIIAILLLTFAATLVNPAGIQGALLPFNILKEYGYSIVENQTLAFLADFFGFNLPIFIFKISVAVLIVSFLLTIKKVKQRIFEILLSAFFIYTGFRMLRNLPLYALASFPVMTVLLTDVFVKLTALATSDGRGTSDVGKVGGAFDVGKRVDNIFKTAVAVFLAFMIFFVVSGGYYKKAGLSKEVGFSVPNGLERAVNFVKENGIKGPMFNNFDIGGYLIWKLPEEKVFVDNRPEAYSVKFFSEIYKPMQENTGKWAEFSEKYGINFIFFAHTDSTPWGQAFLENIVKNPEWKAVYINEDVIILVKNNTGNAEIISQFLISEENAIKRTVGNIGSLNSDSVNLNATLSLFFYNISWREASIYFADETIRGDSQNPYPHLYKGLAYAFYTDGESQKLAGENIKKAIDMGLKESRYYYILGVVYMNLGRLDEARLLLEKALELDKYNEQAKEFLEKYF
jgi:hypothetical protein